MESSVEDGDKNMAFDKINFSKLGIGELISLCISCKNAEDAKKVLEQYEKYCQTPEIARSNLGYIFGYCNEENRKRLYSLFPVNHPMFGASFGRGKDPSWKEAFNIGKNLGEKVKRNMKKE